MHLIVKEPVALQPSQKPDFNPTNGREGETVTFLSRCVVTFGGLGGGFDPRHLNR
ncbi:hypothetical protein BH20ACI2_BH20ACI2_00350 [soil metagenome]